MSPGWRTSSRSASLDCVEVGVEVPEGVGVEWRKSRRSVNNGACLEAAAVRALVLVRDTKEDSLPGRTVLAFAAAAWKVFIAARKAER